MVVDMEEVEVVTVVATGEEADTVEVEVDMVVDITKDMVEE